MTPLPSFYRMNMAELYERILDTYPGIGPRPLVISVPPNSYGKADVIYLDHHGSPPKGYAIYAKAWRGLYVMDPGMSRKRRVGVNVLIEELDALEVGFYTYTPELGIQKYEGGSVD